MSVLLKTTEVEVRHEHQTNVWCDYRLVDFRTNNLVVLLYKCPGSTTRISVTMAGSIRRQLYTFLIWLSFDLLCVVWFFFRVQMFASPLSHDGHTHLFKFAWYDRAYLFRTSHHNHRKTLLVRYMCLRLSSK